MSSERSRLVRATRVPSGTVARAALVGLAVVALLVSTTPDSPAAEPVTYFVAPDGDDDASGTSPASAWRTLQRVSTAPVQPGDRVLLERGGVFTDPLTLTASGAHGNPITIGSWGEGARPVVTGACVHLDGSYLHLQDIEARDCAWAGVTVRGDWNRVDRSVLTRNVAGIHVAGTATGTVIKDNRIVDNTRMSVNTPGGDDDSGAFGVLVNGHDTEIMWNRISGHSAVSYDYGRDGAAIEIYGASGTRVHHNVADENEAFTELGHATTRESSFTYNVVTGTGADQVFLVTRGGGSSWGPVLATSAAHNSVRLTGARAQGFVCYGGCDRSLLDLRANVIEAAGKVGYADGPISSAHNVFFGGARQFQLGATDIVAAPGFLAPGPGNLRLSASSPAIDRCASADPGIDVDGRPAAVDGNGDGIVASDSGAHEWQP